MPNGVFKRRFDMLSYLFLPCLLKYRKSICNFAASSCRPVIKKILGARSSRQKKRIDARGPCFKARVEVRARDLQPKNVRSGL